MNLFWLSSQENSHAAAAATTASRFPHEMERTANIVSGGVSP